MRDIETTLTEIINLATKYEHTYAADYEGALHVRVGRRVVAVFNYTDGTLRINELTTGAQRSRVNDVLAILEANRRAAVVTVDAPAGLEPIPVTVWQLTSNAVEQFTPRTEFSLSALESPAAEWYGQWRIGGECSGEWFPQPRTVRIIDNLRDIEEGI